MPITADTVRWGYRFFLGREPESEDAIRAHLGARNELQLAQALIGSPEFAPKRRQLFATRSEEVRELGILEIDCEASPSELAECLAKIKECWSHLGDVAPHFSVLTDNQFLPENLGNNVDNFWISGQAEADQVIRTLKRHGFSGLSHKTCVEYGCGVGRVTTGLSRRFKRIDGYDISSSHLQLARQRASEIAASNAHFHEIRADVLPELMPCDAFYSRIVFQHNPPPVITELVRCALAALRPEGIAIFQVPSYISGYRFKLREWLAEDHALDMQMHCLPQSQVFGLIAAAGCAVLEVREDGSAGARDRIISNAFVVRKR